MGVLQKIGSRIGAIAQWEFDLGKKIASVAANPLGTMGAMAKWEMKHLNGLEYEQKSESDVKAEVARAIAEWKISRGPSCALGKNARNINTYLAYEIDCADTSGPSMTIARYKPIIPIIAGGWDLFTVTEADAKAFPALAAEMHYQCTARYAEKYRYPTFKRADPI